MSLEKRKAEDLFGQNQFARGGEPQLVNRAIVQYFYNTVLTEQLSTVDAFGAGLRLAARGACLAMNPIRLGINMFEHDAIINANHSYF